MFSNAEIAQVLEDAADLYESEKIQWCSGSWGGHELTLQNEVRVNACAATSIAMAAGVGVYLVGALDRVIVFPNMGEEHVRRAVEHIVQNINPEWRQRTEHNYGPGILQWSPRTVQLYFSARDEVEKRIDTTLPSFNDKYGQNKDAVIQLIKETAKELRNAG